MSKKAIKPAGKRRNHEEYIQRNSRYRSSEGIFLSGLKEIMETEKIKIEHLINVKKKNKYNAIFLLQLEEGE